MGSGEKDQYKVSKAIKKHMDEHQIKDTFVCGLGDNIYENGCRSVKDKQFIDKFEKPYSNIPDKITSMLNVKSH